MSNKSKIFLTVVATVLILGFVVYQAVTSNTQYIGTLNTDIGAIKFVHTDENEGEDLIITSDKKVYQGFSGTTIYFSVNPLLKEAEDVALQFYFTDPNAKAVQIYQRKDNAWWALPLGAGEVTDSKFSESFTRKKEIDGKIYTQSRTFYDSTGETEYFMAELAYTPGTPGQFLIEAFGESGSYGILDPWYDSGWSYRKKITINPQYVADGLSNFPMLFSRTDLDLRATASGGHVASTTGGDILFTAADGATKLDHEIETYTSTTGELVAWVEVPFVSSTSTRDIYIYYGNSTIPLANQQNVTGVWDGNYTNVYHFGNGSTLDLKDSTSNARNLTNSGAVAGIGKFSGGAVVGDSGDDMITDSYAVGATTITAEVWVKATTFDQDGQIFLRSNEDWQAFFNAADDSFYWWGDNQVGYTRSLTGLTNNAWNHIAVSITGTSGKIYYNGGAPTTGTTGAATNGITTLKLGEYTAGSYNFNGTMDEVRVSSVVRSDDWIATEYNNQSSPNTFYSYGGEGIEIRSSSVAGVKIRGGSSTASNWYGTAGWSYRKKITINPQYVADGLSNFPMLFSRTDLDLRATASGGHVASTTGGDILFTAADGATKLDHEIETYTSTTGELVAWVEVPFVSSTSTRDIYIYYGNSTIPLANQQNVTGVWDASYVGVYHMNDNLATTNVKESTSNGFNGTNQANTNTKTTSGKTGSGLTYNGSTDYTTMSDQAGFTPGAGGFTVSAWLKPNSIPPASAGNRMWAVCKCDNPFEWNFTINDNDTAYGKWNFGAFTSDGGSGIAVRPTLTSAVEDSWQYVVATLANTSATPDIFFNGVSDNGTANVSGAPGVTNTSSAVSLGRKAAGGEVLFDGIEDEIRISSTVRSAAWIATEYNNQSSPNTFYSYSGEGVENQSASMPSIKVRGGVKFR